MDLKIKIIYYISTLEAGGAEKVTVNFIRKLDRERFDIYLVLVEKRGSFLELIPDYVKIIDLNSKKTLYSILKLREEIKKIQPDIIYSTLFRTHIAIDLALLFIKKRPKTIFRSPTSPKILIERGELSWIMRLLIERAYRGADKILAQTPQMRDEIAKYHNINIDKIESFLNPLDTKLIDKKIANSLNPFDNSMVNVVVAGRLSKVKGFDTLLYAFNLVLKKNSNFFLHIIGRDAGEKRDLEKIIRELSIESRVKFWGFQDNPYRFFYYSNLFVLSSRREGLPNAVLENLYLKKPVIATRCVPFMSELIDDGRSGFLVDVDDYIALSKAILNYKEIDINRVEDKKEDKSLDINSLLIDLNKLKRV